MRGEKAVREPSLVEERPELISSSRVVVTDSGRWETGVEADEDDIESRSEIVGKRLHDCPVSLAQVDRREQLI